MDEAQKGAREVKVARWIRARRQTVGVARAAACSALALVLVASVGPLAGSGTAGERQDLEYLGVIAGFPQNGAVIQIDEPRRRMYVRETRRDPEGLNVYLLEYDLRPDIPRPVREAKLGSLDGVTPGNSPYKSALNSSGTRLYSLDTNLLRPGTFIHVIDTETLATEASWDLNEAFPGFVATGMTYSERDDHLYLVGRLEGSYNVPNLPTSQVGSTPEDLTVVLALDAATGARAWARALPECQLVLESFVIGSMIAASEQREALYLFCVTGGHHVGNNPGQPGLVRLSTTRNATMAEAQRFPTEFFPVSGSFYRQTATGIAGFDPGSERVFVQSLAERTPGAFVFDGNLSAWVGFVAAPAPTNQYLGVDRRSGRYYMGSADTCHLGPCEGAFLIATDGLATPVPQGAVFPPSVESFISVDPTTRRLFFRTTIDVDGERVPEYAVYRDNTPDPEAPRPQDYDALTSDADEGPDTVTSYSASVNGYGARAHMVGGVTSAYSLFNTPPEHPAIRPGERALTTARVPSVDLRDTGASAIAHGAVGDPLTTTEFSERGFGWPWEPVACLDGGSQPASASAPEAQGASAEVGCDLANQVATGRSSADGFVVGGLSVAGASFGSITSREPERGAVTETMASATGVELAAPDGSAVSIAEVSALATTAARGRPGTTEVTWERRVDGIVVRDAEGNVVISSPGCVSTPEADDCQQVAAAINGALGTRVRVEFPIPALTATPKGAFAGVGQTDADFHQGRTLFNQGTAFDGESESRAVPAMQIVVLNDSTEKSRLLVQVAALEASSIYTISPAPELPRAKPLSDHPANEGVSGSGGSPVVTSVGGGSDPGESGGAKGGAPPAEIAASGTPLQAAPAGSLPEGLAVVLRSVPQALLFGMTSLLFLAAVASVLRRRSLLEVIGARGGG